MPDGINPWWPPSPPRLHVAYHRAGEIAIVAGRHGVLQDGCRGRKDGDAHPPGVHPDVRRKIEVLRDALVEHEAFRQIVGIGEPHGVADAVEAVLVESLLRQVRSTLIAGEDVGSIRGLCAGPSIARSASGLMPRYAWRTPASFSSACPVPESAMRPFSST